ncbi:hypothetical protein HDU98_002345, partial [Podochytrium sp. JEL0797]
MQREIADLLAQVAHQKEAIRLLQILTGKLPFGLGSNAVSHANIENVKLAIAFNDQVIHKLLVDRPVTLRRKVIYLVELAETVAATDAPAAASPLPPPAPVLQPALTLPLSSNRPPSTQLPKNPILPTLRASYGAKTTLNPSTPNRNGTAG